jgi:calcium-dependent protein kinase
MYIAPEIISQEKYSNQVDIWALGLIIDEIIHGSSFFKGKNEIDVLLMIKTVEYYIRDE